MLPQGWRDQWFGEYLVRRTTSVSRFGQETRFDEHGGRLRLRFIQKHYSSIRVIKDGQRLGSFNKWREACAYAKQRSRDDAKHT